MTIDTLKAIAALVNTLPHSAYPRVVLGTDARPAFEQLTALGGTSRASLYADPPRVIEGACLEVDGVSFDALFSREPTEEERERIAKEAHVIAPELRAV